MRMWASCLPSPPSWWNWKATYCQGRTIGCFSSGIWFFNLRSLRCSSRRAFLEFPSWNRVWFSWWDFFSLQFSFLWSEAQRLGRNFCKHCHSIAEWKKWSNSSKNPQWNDIGLKTQQLMPLITRIHCTIRHASLSNNFPNHAFRKLPGNFPTNRYREFGACCQGGLFALVPQLSDFGKPDYLGAHLLAAHYLFDSWQASAGTTAVCWQSIHHETPRVWKHETCHPRIAGLVCMVTLSSHMIVFFFLLRCCTAVARKKHKTAASPRWWPLNACAAWSVSIRLVCNKWQKRPGSHCVLSEDRPLHVSCLKTSQTSTALVRFPKWRFSTSLANNPWGFTTAIQVLFGGMWQSTAVGPFGARAFSVAFQTYATRMMEHCGRCCSAIGGQLPFSILMYCTTVHAVHISWIMMTSLKLNWFI